MHALARLKTGHVTRTGDLLILDDPSCVRWGQVETSALVELIVARYERKSLALMANQLFSGWNEVFPTPPMTVMLASRLHGLGTGQRRVQTV